MAKVFWKWGLLGFAFFAMAANSPAAELTLTILQTGSVKGELEPCG
jgi:hypothetical protein